MFVLVLVGMTDESTRVFCNMQYLGHLVEQESLAGRIAGIVGSWELLVGGNGFGLGGNSRNCIGHGQ